MRKYKNFNLIKKNDIAEFGGLENERLFSPIAATQISPLEISCFGITYPDKNYFIKRSPSPCFILEYIEQGTGYLEINGKKHKLGAHDAYIIHPGDHCTYYADKTDPYKKLWINFRSSLFFDVLKRYEISERVFRSVDLTDCFDKIFATEQLSRFNDDLYIPISRVLYDAVFYLSEINQKEKRTHELDLALMVKDALDHSALTPTTLDDLAKQFFHSKNDIIRQFKSAYGITPYAYLISQRIQLAKNLLVTTKMTVKDIAKHLCFSSEYYFSNYFKQSVGLSPRAYRIAEAVKNKSNDE